MEKSSPIVLCFLLLTAAATMMAARLWVVGRGTTFFYDEWDFVQRRRAGWEHSIFSGHNGHPSLVPVLVYRLLFGLVGLRHYAPYRVVPIALHLLCVFLLFAYASRRLHPAMATIIAASFLFLGRSWDMIWPFQMGYQASVAAGLACLLLLEARGRRAELAASSCLIISVASSGIGLSLVGGILVGRLFARDLRRLWIPLLPLSLYGLWLLLYGESQAHVANIPKIPGFVASAAAGAAGSIVGVDLPEGRVAVLLLIAAVVFALVRARGIPAPLATVVVTALLFWFGTALSRAQFGEPAASRYLYPGAAFVLLVVVESLRGLRIHAAVPVVLAAVLPLAVVSNLDVLRAGASNLRDTSAMVAAELSAMEQARPHVPGAFQPDLQRMPQVAAAPYFAAVDALGSPADSEKKLRQRPEPVRAAADRVFLTLYDDVLSSPSSRPRGAAPQIGRSKGELVRQAHCFAVTPSVSPALLEFTVPGAGAIVEAGRAPAEIRLRRYGDTFPPEPAAQVPDRAVLILQLPLDQSGRSWTAQVTSPASLRVCSAG